MLKTEVKSVLLQQLLKGEIKPGDRISLPKLAKSLEVSVTPLREALTQLTENNIITYIANRGFFVTILSEDEARDLYELISVLEGNAIRKIDFDDECLNELERINNDFRNANSTFTKLNCDMNFHRKLIEKYGNQYALKIIEDIRIKIFIYEQEFMKSISVDKSANMHQEIIDLIRNDEVEKAVILLIENWKLSIHHIITPPTTKY